MGRQKADPVAQARALNLLARGLISMAEAARLCGVSRPTVHRWCVAAGIDAPKVRAARAAAEWRWAGEREKLAASKRANAGGEDGGDRPDRRRVRK